MSSPASSPGTPTNQVQPKRKYTTSACSNCRRRRVKVCTATFCNAQNSLTAKKCSGNPPPCENCDKLGVECRFDERSDGRMKIIRRQRVEDAENNQQLLDTVLALLRDTNDENATRLTAFLREGTADRVWARDAWDSSSLESSTRDDTKSDAEDSLQKSEHSPSSRLTTAEDSERLSTRKREPKSISSVGATSIAPGSVRSFGNLVLSNAIRANRYSAEAQAQQLKAIHARPETCLPLHIYMETGGMAGIAANTVLSFQNAARSQILQGVDPRKVLSMDTFDLDLFYRDRTPDDEHTVAGWACEWGKIWTDLSVELQLATIHHVGSLMRWLVMPCKETYEMMSPLIRPLPCQLMIPHTMDIDLWGAPPIVREIQLLYGKGWFDRITPSTLRIDWRHGPDSCTESMTIPCGAVSPDALPDGKGGHYRTIRCFSPVFIACIDKAENWSIHRDLLCEIPELEGRVQFHDD